MQQQRWAEPHICSISLSGKTVSFPYFQQSVDVVSVEALLCLSEAQLLLCQGPFLRSGPHLFNRLMHQCSSFHPYKQRQSGLPEIHLVKKTYSSQEKKNCAHPPWDLSLAGATVELLACSARPFSGVPGTTGERVSLFAEGLLSAEIDTLESGTCATSCCCELATFPFPLSPELVLPVSLVSLEDRPLLLSWGTSVKVLPGPRLPWPPILCSSFAAVKCSLLRVADLVASLCAGASLFDFSMDKALGPLGWDCLTGFTGLMDSSIPPVLLLLSLVESTPRWGWPGRKAT